MKVIAIFLLCAVLLFSFATASPFWDLLFGTHRQSRDDYGHHHHHHSDDGNSRYKEICRVHHVDSLQFPGALGNPICP